MFFRSIPRTATGKSRTCPIEELIVNPSPKYLEIVFDLAGDSTITNVFLAIGNPSVTVRIFNKQIF